LQTQLLIMSSTKASSNVCVGPTEKQVGECRCTAFGIHVFFLLMWITGAVLLSIGITMKNEADRFDPDTDFAPILSPKCVVTNVTHEAEQRQDKNPFCVDVYTYTFRMGDKTFTSGADEKQRKKGTWCESSFQIPTKLTVGTETKCWQPIAGNDKAELASFYKCGNGDCIKILDPAQEYAVKYTRAKLFKGLGTAFLSVGLPFWVFFALLGFKAHEVMKVKVKVNAKEEIFAGELVKGVGEKDSNALYQKA